MDLKNYKVLPEMIGNVNTSFIHKFSGPTFVKPCGSDIIQGHSWPPFGGISSKKQQMAPMDDRSTIQCDHKKCGGFITKTYTHLYPIHGDLMTSIVSIAKSALTAH